MGGQPSKKRPIRIPISQSGNPQVVAGSAVVRPSTAAAPPASPFVYPTPRGSVAVSRPSAVPTSIVRVTTVTAGASTATSTTVTPVPIAMSSSSSSSSSSVAAATAAVRSLSSSSRSRRERGEKPDAVVPGEFKFLTPEYANSNIIIENDRTLVTRRSATDCSIVFLDQELSSDKKLAVSVVRKGTNSATFSFAFGLTTCDTRSVRENECHAVSTCASENSCRGRCLMVEVRHCRRPGDCVIFEWKRNKLHISGRANFAKYDKDRVFAFNRKAYPFIVMSGEVSSLKIIREEEATSSTRPNSTANPQVGNTVSGAGAGSSAPRGKWLANKSVSFVSFEISRLAPPGYIFRDTLLEYGRPINFQVLQISSMTNGTLTIGVTSKTPSSIKVMGLSVYPPSMALNSTWTGTLDVWKSLTIFAPLDSKWSIRRTFDKIQVLQHSAFGWEGSREEFDLDQSARVYPFFCFNGDIKSIRLLNERMEPIVVDRPATSRVKKKEQSKKEGDPPCKSDAPQNECCICMDQTRVIMCEPCHHVVYCEDCKPEAERQGTRTCPMCRANVSSFLRIYL